MASESDINPFNLLACNSSKSAPTLDVPKLRPEDPEVPKVKFNPDDDFYDMSGEKYLLVFAHYEYDAGTLEYYKNPPKKRIGTDEDVTVLKKTFKKIGFKVLVYSDKTRKEIFDILCNIRETNYSSASCFCLAILTHGGPSGALCAQDKYYDFKDVLMLFQNHESLVGKPKLFFVQACRGCKMDDGIKIDIDGHKKTEMVIPSHADCLVMRSTVEDYLSYRDCLGSWMIQELCKGIDKHHDDLDILHIVTLVQKAVAYGYATYTPKDRTKHNKRQMPETTFTLTKFLKF